MYPQWIMMDHVHHTMFITRMIILLTHHFHNMKVTKFPLVYDHRNQDSWGWHCGFLAEIRIIQGCSTCGRNSPGALVAVDSSCGNKKATVLAAFENAGVMWYTKKKTHINHAQNHHRWVYHDISSPNCRFFFLCVGFSHITGIAINTPT